MALFAQKHAKPKLRLNLIYSQTSPTKLSIKFLKWLLSYGRYIAIVVEIIVLLTFGLRFKMDADLAAITEQVNAKSEGIRSLSQDEAVLRQTHLRLSTIKTEFEKLPTWQKNINSLSSIMPAGVTLSSFVIEPKDENETLGFRINATAISATDLGIFINALKSSANFKNINLTNISFEEGRVAFTVTGDIN